MHSYLASTTPRRGTTILEVLFAIFVVIVGLLGIASIIPLAARNANESNEHNNVQSLGPRWLQGFTARGLNVSNSYEDKGQGYNWLWLQDYGNTQGFRQYRKSYVGAAESGVIGLAGTLNSSPTGSAVTASQIQRIWGYQSVCIDPTFFTEPDVRQRILGGASRVGGYRAAVFPYFEDGFNPVTDPAAPANAWPDQPRMVRVTLSGTGGQVSRKLVDEIFSSADDLAMSTFVQDANTGERVVDDTLPAMRLFQVLAASGAQKAIANPEYSWLITASPEEPTGLPTTPDEVNATSRYYTVTLVVMHRRDRQFIAPPPATLQAGSTEDKPAGERLVWVYPLSGNFTNGNGGRVRLIANAATDDSVHIGDWIMLGKQFLVNPALTAQQYSFFRWYRVVAVDQESQVDLLANRSPVGTDPFGNAANQPVWSRDVVLEGPDFNFATPTGSVVTPTTGTLLQGVVSVLERRLAIH